VHVSNKVPTRDEASSRASRARAPATSAEHVEPPSAPLDLLAMDEGVEGAARGKRRPLAPLIIFWLRPCLPH
jgi:hypothetical protein